MRGVVRPHSDDAAEDLEGAAVPVFRDVVVGGEASIDEGAEVFTDDVTAVPLGDAEAAGCVFREAVKA